MAILWPLIRDLWPARGFDLRGRSNVTSHKYLATPIWTLHEGCARLG